MSMSFKSVTIGALASAAIVSGATLSATPASAISLAPGDFTLEGTSSVSEFSGAGDTEFDLNFLDMGIVSSNGAFTGLTGSPLVQSLSISQTGATTFTGGGETNFITGLALSSGESVVVDLNPFSLSGSISSPQLYSFAGALNGVVRASSSSAQANVILGAFNIDFGSIRNNNTQIAVETREVPTPALLPGLLGLGVAASRKRRSGDEDGVSA